MDKEQRNGKQHQARTFKKRKNFDYAVSLYTEQQKGNLIKSLILCLCKKKFLIALTRAKHLLCGKHKIVQRTIYPFLYTFL